VAGVSNAFGRGRAVLLGTFAGMCATAHSHRDADGFMERLLREAGVRGDRHGGLLRRVRRLENREAWFLINPQAGAVTASVALEGFTAACDLLEGPLEVRDGQVAVTVAATSVACLIVDR
jgi:hypothetical protein